MTKSIWILLFASFISYSCFVYSNCDSKETAAPDNRVSAGWRIWQGKNCQSCHQLYGLGGYMGPDLTNTASEKGAGYMRGFIKHGTGRMPDFQLNNREVDELIAFLSWVDKSGRSAVNAASVHWSGTYINR